MLTLIIIYNYICVCVCIIDVKSQAKAKVDKNDLDPVREDKGQCSVTEAAWVKAKNAVCLIKAP